MTNPKKYKHMTQSIEVINHRWRIYNDTIRFFEEEFLRRCILNALIKMKGKKPPKWPAKPLLK